MKKISLAKASSYTSPNPVTVVCTTKADGTPNLATVSWWTYLSLLSEHGGVCHGKDLAIAEKD